MAEPAAARLSRLLALVPWLEQHPGVSVQEAAAHFGVTPAELERDLWLTVCCGLPGHGPDQLIDIQFWDDDGTIDVIDAQTLDRPLRLSANEAMSLLVGLRLLAQIPGDHDRTALASATAKLEAAMDDGEGSAVVVQDDTDDSLVATLSDALTRARAVRITYAGASRDEVTHRVVEPGGLLTHAGRAYLVGWCREAGAERTFRLDRVRSAEVLDESAVQRSGRPETQPAHGQAVRLRVAPRSRWLLESWDTTEHEVLADGTLETTILVADTEWLTRIVLGHGGGVVVVAPEGLRVQVRDAALRARDSLVHGRGE